MLKLIGLSLILTASGAVGAGLAGTVRRQPAPTRALIDALLRIRHELLYRLTPLPEIFTVLKPGVKAERLEQAFIRYPMQQQLLRLAQQGLIEARHCLSLNNTF